MSVLKEVPQHAVLSGLKLKRKLGEKIVIRHKGDSLVFQVVAFVSGWQVLLAFQGDQFDIMREEVSSERTS